MWCQLGFSQSDHRVRVGIGRCGLCETGLITQKKHFKGIVSLSGLSTMAYLFHSKRLSPTFIHNCFTSRFLAAKSKPQREATPKGPVQETRGRRLHRLPSRGILFPWDLTSKTENGCRFVIRLGNDRPSLALLFG